jgi:zinc protease
VVGDAAADAVRDLLQHALGDWVGAERLRVMPTDRASSTGARTTIIDKPGAPQAEIRIGHRSVPRSHEDYFPLVVMNALLGGLFSSRINMNLRERNGYTYGARSTIEWRRGAGPLTISTAVKTDVTAPAIREIFAEVDRMRAAPVTVSELDLATAYLAGVFPIRFETTDAVADAIARAECHELGDDYYSRYPDRIRAVSADDVLRAAQNHLDPEAMRIVIVGAAAAIAGPMTDYRGGNVQVVASGAGS